jgi:tetratricopeptide (TPR) repeat protein
VNVRGITVGLALASLPSLLVPGAAVARNPHCAGGIQYFVQADADKQKGNNEDYQREIMKAVSQFEACATEDSLDYEAMAYLGRAYAEIESCGPSGQAFARAIGGLTAKGDKKKAEDAATNRDHYWVAKLNDGVSKIGSAQSAYPDFTKKPENDADKTLHAEADKFYQQALTSLTCASLLRPGHPGTLRSLGSIYLARGDYSTAEAVFREGLKSAPNDSTLKAALQAARFNHANQLTDDKRYDEAIAIYSDLAKTSQDDASVHSGLANAYLSRAQIQKGDARKPDFKLAGVEYQRAAELRKDDADQFYNAAVSYQNAGEVALAEGMWRAALKLKPEDIEIQSELAGVETQLGKYPEAVSILQSTINADPKNKKLHRQLGDVYTRSNNNSKATEELMIFLALQNGQPAANASAAAKAAPAGTDAAKTLASMGTPEEVYPWEAQGDKYESWFYWSKKQAYHFKAGVLSTKSDWSGSSGATGSKN